MTVVHGNPAETGHADAGWVLEHMESATGQELCELICDAEELPFTAEQRPRVMPLLWRYILEHRDSPHRDEITAVGAALRKYVGMMDATLVEGLAVLLEGGHGAALPLEIELELIKMVHRKYEAHPPVRADVESELAGPLWEIAREYGSARVLPHGKHAAVALCATLALVALRSRHAADAVGIACGSPHQWFAEMVTDGIRNLSAGWMARNREAGLWCGQLVENAGAMRVKRN